MNMDAKTAKSGLTRAIIIGTGLDLVAAQGLHALTLQAVADRVGLSKSGVFSRVGSREALQKAVIAGLAGASWPMRWRLRIVAPPTAQEP